MSQFDLKIVSLNSGQVKDSKNESTRHFVFLVFHSSPHNAPGRPHPEFRNGCFGGNMGFVAFISSPDNNLGRDIGGRWLSAILHCLYIITFLSNNFYIYIYIYYVIYIIVLASVKLSGQIQSYSKPPNFRRRIA